MYLAVTILIPFPEVLPLWILTVAYMMIFFCAALSCFAYLRDNKKENKERVANAFKWIIIGTIIRSINELYGLSYYTGGDADQLKSQLWTGLFVGILVNFYYHVVARDFASQSE